MRRLPAKVQQCGVAAADGGLRVPGHQVILDVLRMLVGPLALSSANQRASPKPSPPKKCSTPWASDVDLVLDDGPCRFGEPSSVVRVEGNRYEILRPGVVPEKTLQRLASLMILFVCTGNTCRSPMAEAICRQLLAKRLGCKIERIGGPRGTGHVGGHRRHAGRPGQPRGGRRSCRRWGWTFATTKPSR